MPNTYTQIITAAALGAAGQDGTLQTLATLGATTSQYALEAILTNGAINDGNLETVVRVYFATSNLAAAPANYPATFGPYCKSFDIHMKPGANSVTVKSCVPFVPTGSRIFVWVDRSKGAATISLSVWLSELSSS
jgi:hypothetical protein